MPELLASFAVTLAAMPFVLRAMLRWRVLDVPNDRSSHLTVVPRGGGLACLCGVLAGLAIATVRSQGVPWFLAFGATLLALVGFADDRRTLAAAPRLGAQVAAGALIGMAGGTGWWLLAGMVAIPIAVNVVNFMDGINGITGITVAAWGFVAMTVGAVQEESSLVVIGAVTAGSATAFLPWNTPTARIFLGDSGSYLLGSLVGIGVLMGVQLTRSAILLIAPLSLYLADTTMTLLRRKLRGESLFTAHREHTYQKLVNQNGLSQTSVACTTTALALVITASWVPGSLVLGIATSSAIVSLYLNSPRILGQILRPPTSNSEQPGTS